MKIRTCKIDIMHPPKDDLFKKISAAKIPLKDGDIIAVSSKVVSIHEGRTVKVEDRGEKLEMAKKEADRYFETSDAFSTIFTIKNGVLIRSAGIDESNGNGHFVLWPENPKRSARTILFRLKRIYNIKKLGLIITDSFSVPLRRGAIGFALAYAGFQPLFDYRGKPDIFGRKLKAEQMNIADALAAAAVVEMGEGDEQTPIAVINGAKHVDFSKKKSKKPFSSFEVPFEEDIFAPFWQKVKWRKNRKRFAAGKRIR